MSLTGEETFDDLTDPDHPMSAYCRVHGTITGRGISYNLFGYGFPRQPYRDARKKLFPNSSFITARGCMSVYEYKGFIAEVDIDPETTLIRGCIVKTNTIVYA